MFLVLDSSSLVFLDRTGHTQSAQHNYFLSFVICERNAHRRTKLDLSLPRTASVAVESRLVDIAQSPVYLSFGFTNTLALGYDDCFYYFQQ